MSANFNIVISRCTFISGISNDSPRKIVGFNVQNKDASKELYHETTLQPDQFSGKTDEECVDIAFGILSGSIAGSIQKLTSESSVVGNFYIPN
jgi:hypothetical protein